MFRQARRRFLNFWAITGLIFGGLLTFLVVHDLVAQDVSGGSSGSTTVSTATDPACESTGPGSVADCVTELHEKGSAREPTITSHCTESAALTAPTNGLIVSVGSTIGVAASVTKTSGTSTQTYYCTFTNCDIHLYPDPPTTHTQITWPTLTWTAGGCGNAATGTIGTSPTSFTATAASTSVNSSSVVLTGTAGSCQQCGSFTPSISPTTKNFTVIGVKSISGCGKISTKSSGLGETETIFSAPYVDAGLTANPDPNSTWPEDEPSWHCECWWPICFHLSASGASCTFNSSSTGDYTVRAECGDSNKRIMISNQIPILKTVLFAGDITIKKDDGSGDYSGNDWELGRVPQNPIAYTSTSKCKAGKVTFEHPAGKNYDVTLSNIKVRFGPPGWFSSYSAIVSGSCAGKTVTALDIEATDQFYSSAKVGYENSYSLGWQISFDGASHWHSTSSNTNELYLTWNGTSSSYETIFHISCTNATGDTSESRIVSDVWNKFSSLVVKRKDNGNLIYNGGNENRGVGGLLAVGNGDCRDWADFFVECLNVQGLAGVYASTRVSATSPSIAMFMKAWLFSSNINDTTWESGTANQCVPVAGMPYQGVTNPDAALFGFHQIVYHSEAGVFTYYDPTYGIKINESTLYAAKESYENSTIQGFYRTGPLMKLNKSALIETAFVP